MALSCFSFKITTADIQINVGWAIHVYSKWNCLRTVVNMDSKEAWIEHGKGLIVGRDYPALNHSVTINGMEWNNGIRQSKTTLLSPLMRYGKMCG